MESAATVGEQETSILNIPSAVMMNILGQLSAPDLAKAACVHRSWQSCASEELLWEQLCLIESIKICTTPDGKSCSSHREAYGAWHREFFQYKSLFPRAKKCLEGLKTWTSQNMPEVAASLGDGASEEELCQAEKDLGLALPPGLRIFYRLCNGQELKYDNDYESDCTSGSLDPSIFHGLLGGYSFYDHHVSVRLLPLRRIVKISASPRFRDVIRMPNSKRVLVAASYNFVKLFFVDCEDGLVYVGTRDVIGNGRMVCCVPDETAVPVEDSICKLSLQEGAMPLQLDGFLRWMEKYLAQLQSGFYGVRQLNEWAGSRGICLFPETEPECSKACTHRVQVRGSSLFIPEHSTLERNDPDNRYYFAYSVRMSLLPAAPGDLSYGPMLGRDSCQLTGRHWVIKEANTVANEIRANAVIGQYPILREGAEEFVYQSCNGSRSTVNSIEGEFSFVPGSLLTPLGEEFEARVAPIEMRLPSFIF